jgi:hypothetical protein
VEFVEHKEHISKALSLTGLQYETHSWFYTHKNYNQSTRSEILTATLLKIQVFWGRYLVTLKIKALRSTETSVTIYQSIMRDIPEDLNLRLSTLNHTLGNI